MQRRKIDYTAELRKWFAEPPLAGPSALAWTAVAFAIPATLRMTVEAGMTEYQCITFCPFVLLSAILAGWRYAALLAVAATFFCNLVMTGPPYSLHEDASELIGMSASLAYSFLLVGFVELARRMTAKPDVPASEPDHSGIIFSLEDGVAWARWRGTHVPVELGRKEEVAEMMEDFLAQVELGDRLCNRCR